MSDLNWHDVNDIAIELYDKFTFLLFKLNQYRNNIYSR